MFQFFKYSIIGLSSSVVNLIVYNIFLLIFSNLGWFQGFEYLIAQFIGFVVSVFESFLLNRKFVFSSNEENNIPWYKALAKMYVAYSFTGVVVDSILSIIWVQIIGFPKEIVTILNDLICWPLDYLLHKFWSFRGKK